MLASIHVVPVPAYGKAVIVFADNSIVLLLQNRTDFVEDDILGNSLWYNFHFKTSFVE